MSKNNFVFYWTSYSTRVVSFAKARADGAICQWVRGAAHSPVSHMIPYKNLEEEGIMGT